MLDVAAATLSFLPVSVSVALVVARGNVEDPNQANSFKPNTHLYPLQRKKKCILEQK